jgi:hypothetical protein
LVIFVGLESYVDLGSAEGGAEAEGFPKRVVRAGLTAVRHGFGTQNLITMRTPSAKDVIGRRNPERIMQARFLASERTSNGLIMRYMQGGRLVPAHMHSFTGPILFCLSVRLLLL